MVEAAAMDIFLPVMESAVVLAAHYCKAAGRDCVQAEDMRIGLMFAARNVAGKHLGTLYPELYEESHSDSDGESEDSGSWETVSGEGEDEEADESHGDSDWCPYTGTEDEMARKMNECAETWDEWEPETPAERALKNAVDKQREE
jgi:hypothetical protein